LIAGVIHEGTPEGKWETIGGIECYVATPTVEYPKDAVILYIPDAFGVQLVNNQVRWLSTMAKYAFLRFDDSFIHSLSWTALRRTDSRWLDRT
jgi:hypothetical protein